MRRIRCFAMLSMTILLASCSVKEDRSDCPCWITVTANETMSLSAWYGSQKILDNHIGGLVDYTVPRGIVDLVASNGAFTVPVGEQMDELFAQLQHLDTDGEFANTGIELKKQFATVSIDFKDEDDGRTGYDLLVTGSVAGANPHTLEPQEGLFRCIPEPITEGRGYTFRAPRQKDESLTLLLQAEGETVDIIPLGELIRKAGFDWKRESLGDVAILCDLPARTFTISVMDWEGPVTFEITI